MISVHEGCYSQSYISFCIFWHSLWLSASNIWPNRQRLYEISFDFVRFDGESQNIFHNLVVLWLFENLKVFKIINIFLFSSSENHSQLFQLKQSTEWEQNTAPVPQCRRAAVKESEQIQLAAFYRSKIRISCQKRRHILLSFVASSSLPSSMRPY